MMKRLLPTKKYMRLLVLVLFCLALLVGATACGLQDDVEVQATNADTVSQTGPVTAPQTPVVEDVTQPQKQTATDAASESQAQQTSPTKDSSQTKTITSTQTSTPEKIFQSQPKSDLTCTFSVECKTILDNMDDFDPDKLSVLPEDGVILAPTTVTFAEGKTVFDVLIREMQANKIQMEFVSTPIYNSNYIEGIHNIYEFDCGPLSGWMYTVNGSFPTYGSSLYELKDGDVIQWVYSCELGKDVGGNNITGDEK